MATAKKKSVFETLSAIDVTPYVEKKGGMDYLSWAVAWGILKQMYPKATRKIYEHEHTGLNFFSDGQTAYVKVGITVEGEEHIDMLPVMDYRNKSISIDKMTSFDVNKTIQRATAKAIAMHGLSISLWWKNAEDLSEIKSTDTKSEIKSKGVAVDTKKIPKKVSPKTPKKVVLQDIPKEKMAEMLKYVAQNKHLGFDQLVANIETRYNVNKEQQKIIKKEIEK
jgi:hypothetical protein